MEGVNDQGAGPLKRGKKNRPVQGRQCESVTDDALRQTTRGNPVLL